MFMNFLLCQILWVGPYMMAGSNLMVVIFVWESIRGGNRDVQHRLRGLFPFAPSLPGHGLEATFFGFRAGDGAPFLGQDRTEKRLGGAIGAALEILWKILKKNLNKNTMKSGFFKPKWGFEFFLKSRSAEKNENT